MIVSVPWWVEAVQRSGAKAPFFLPASASTRLARPSSAMSSSGGGPMVMAVTRSTPASAPAAVTPRQNNKGMPFF